MHFELFVIEGELSEEKVRFAVTPNNEIIRISSFQLFVVDVFKNLIECSQDEFWYIDPNGRKEFLLFLTKKKLMEKKKEYLPNDVLSLQCEFSFTSGIVFQETNKIIAFSPSIESTEQENRRLQDEKDLPVPKGILIDNLKSMLNNSCFSDVKLRTNGQVYFAHKCILSSRSTVFEAMFSNDMKEKMNDCVDIEDLNDDTVLRMLRYIYSAEVEELEWDSAAELYEAADKYQLLDLNGICSCYLKDNLQPSNACATLVLADLHQDEELRCFARDFILRHGKDINSEEWEKLLSSNLKLAAEMMRLKFQE
ncbi:TD and POZ domain-containing protein 1 [Argiope bruennichi]|uniref:TD and POZ domain-containing protein 1 n=1 Tax=Argiope bruennichi TaxID=94029 RepID=A0A8T0EE21_ARGBR|nr:TD and POZ domain-containing protein 1 [Argiope bruennichi]